MDFIINIQKVIITAGTSCTIIILKTLISAPFKMISTASLIPLAGTTYRFITIGMYPTITTSLNCFV
jgi:hypothetical protein